MILEFAGLGRVLIKLVMVQVTSDGSQNLIVSTSQSSNHALPDTISTVASAVHLDQAWSILGQDEFSWRRSVLDAQGIQDLKSIVGPRWVSGVSDSMGMSPK